ncbi:MAG: hypothetical protein OXH14_17040 [Alphaproteobacteria bacterium]|nr:hypothetical protein [Alphaproteobacteria bacterium]
MTVAAAAEAAGAGERSVYRWRRDPAFRKAVADRAAELLEDQRSHIGAMLAAAVQTVRDRLAAGEADAAALAIRLLTGGQHLMAFTGGAAAGMTRHEHRGALSVADALATLDLNALPPGEIRRLRLAIEALERADNR